MSKPKKTSKPESEILARKNPELKLMSNQTKEEHAKKYAELVLSPELAAYRVLSSADGQTSIFKEGDVPSYMNALREQAAAVNRGEMNHIEAMLMNQASALQCLFTRMTERANQQEHMPNLEGLMRMALRAQNQCRATLETLAAIKNPPVVFAKQANINQGGNQQVNNGTPSHAGKSENQPNELLEVQNGSKTLDSRTTGGAIVKDTALEALETVHRGTDTGRQG